MPAESAAAPVRALDAGHYTDPTGFERERERVFRRTWQYAGHASQIRNPGDYFAFDVHGRRLFCVRQRDASVAAFYNVCVHRGHELVSGTGNERVLVCPYHSWTYELDGSFRAAPGMDRVPGFEGSGICLTRVRTEVVGGFVFVNPDRDAAPMEDWYPGLEAALREYVPDLDRLRPAFTRTVIERCNWKVSVENYNECYHCRVNHPAFASGVVDPDSYDIVPAGRMLCHLTKSVALESMSYDIDAAAHPRALDYRSWFLWPAFSFQVYPGNVLNTYLWRAIDHCTTEVTRQWFSVDGQESDSLRRLAEQDLSTTVAEDVRLVEAVQRGLESGGYRPAPLIVNPRGGVDSEHSIAALYGWRDEALAG